uniref:ribosomal protein S2 n=1 Tax=Prototheca paracutis TaxID=2034905 RepID=UPI003001D228
MQKEKITLKEMFKQGMHLGHLTSEWNPRMDSFIYSELKKRHILDLVQSYTLLNDLLKFLEKSASQGKKFLFIGTKKHIASLIKETAISCNSFYVNQRWLGGMLTNWRTVRSSLNYLKRLRKSETSGTWSLLKKKEIASLIRAKLKLESNLSGLEYMKKLPDIVIVVGQSEEFHAIKECRRLGIETVSILDSNCDPSLVDWYIISNDDSYTSVQFILSKIMQAILSGQEFLKQQQQLLYIQQKKRAQRRQKKKSSKRGFKEYKKKKELL